MTHRIEILFYILLLLANSCSIMPEEPGEPNANINPETTLANLPPDDPEGSNPINPEITFYWTGTDKDGYIDSFKYRWCNIENTDTVWTKWFTISAVDTSGNSGKATNSVTLIIDSPKERNQHSFEISSIDNKGASDQTPARVRFCTKKGTASETILSQYPASECIVNDNITQSWQGLLFTFSDIYSKYSYKINSGSWNSFSDTNLITLTGKDFPASGSYKIYFKSKNKYAVEDDTPLEFDISIIKPDYLKDVLLIDMTTDGIGIIGSPSDEEVDGFYESICKELGVTNYTLHDVKTNGFPSRKTLAAYKYLIIYSDYPYSEFENKLLKTAIDALSDYLNTGGKSIFSGWIPSNMFFNSSLADTFFYKYSQVKFTSETITEVELKCNNLQGYPVLQIDDSKFPSEWANRFSSLELYTPRAFSNKIYSLNSSSIHNGKTLVSLLRTDTYKTILSSLPLYYFNKNEVKIFFTKALQDLK